MITCPYTLAYFSLSMDMAEIWKRKEGSTNHDKENMDKMKLGQEITI